MDPEIKIEEWTRSRYYSRIRRLFEEESMLSTISEGDESLVQYLSTLHSKSDIHSKNGSEVASKENRPPSPLPDLLIEVVPKRPRTCCDESVEFYAALEKEMQRLYRRDYLHIYSDNNSEEEIESFGSPGMIYTEDTYYDKISNYKTLALNASKNFAVGEAQSVMYVNSNKLSNTEYNIHSQTISNSSLENNLLLNKTILLQECKTKSITESEIVTDETTYEDNTVYECVQEKYFKNCARFLSPGNESKFRISEQESKEEEAIDNKICQEQYEVEEEEIDDRSDTKKCGVEAEDGEEVVDNRGDPQVSDGKSETEEGEEMYSKNDTKKCEEETEAEEEEDILNEIDTEMSGEEPEVDKEDETISKIDTNKFKKESEDREEVIDNGGNTQVSEEKYQIEQGEEMYSESDNKECEEESEAEEGEAIKNEKDTEMSEEEPESEEGEEAMEELAENKAASSVKSDTFSIPEPDVVRRGGDTRLSSVSIPSRYSQGFEAEILGLHKNQLLMEVELNVDIGSSSSNEIQRRENTPDTSIVNYSTSTPKSFVFRTNCSKKYTNRFKPYYPHACKSSRKQVSNKTLQTSFSEDESDTENLWKNFFVGTPYFYKLV